MDKVLAVAKSEYANAVRSKAFLVGVFLMPVLMFGGILVMSTVRDQVDLRDRRFAVVDRTGRLWDAIEQAAEQREEQEVYEVGEDGTRKQVQPRFVPERYAPQDDGDGGESSVELELSDRVRAGELFAFVVIDPGVITQEPGQPAEISYYTETPTFQDLPRWIGSVLSERIRALRFAAEPGLDPALVAHVTRPTPLRKLGLTSRSKTGEVIEAEEESEVVTFLIPAAAMMLLFMMVMTTAPYMLNAVLEEKMQKISEVLVAAVSPFQLMLGKVVASTCVSLTLSLLYLGAIFGVTRYYGVDSFIPYEIYPWFFLFQILALLIYGSMFSAVGAACSEMRDAQSMMMPAMLVVMVPLFVWSVVLQSPDSPLAVGLSLVPTATPMLMLLRIAIPPGPPIWQVGLSVVLTVLFTLFCVWAAGKIFRIGLLSQGKAPSFPTLVRWVFSRQ